MAIELQIESAKRHYASQLAAYTFGQWQSAERDSLGARPDGTSSTTNSGAVTNGLTNAATNGDIDGHPEPGPRPHPSLALTSDRDRGSALQSSAGSPMHGVVVESAVADESSDGGPLYRRNEADIDLSSVRDALPSVAAAPY